MSGKREEWNRVRVRVEGQPAAHYYLAKWRTNVRWN